VAFTGPWSRLTSLSKRKKDWRKRIGQKCSHIFIIIITITSPKSPLFEHKTDIILRNRHWHRFRSFIVVYFIFCFRKKIFFQSQQYNIGFSWKHFLRFLIFFKMNPKYFSLRRSCRLNRVFYRLPWKYAQKMQQFSCIFCATFRTKLCNTRFKRQDLLREVVDSKMFLFYCSQIGQCSCICMSCVQLDCLGRLWSNLGSKIWTKHM